MDHGMPGADLLCIAIGLLAYGYALRDARLVLRLRREGLRTEGIVVANVADRRDRNPIQTPVIRFRDHQGHDVRFTPAASGIGLGLATGRHVDVVYLPTDPQKARVRMRRHMMAPMAGLTLCGTLFLGFGLLIAFA
ncbi:DUF3592 domain-containing protein [Streptomyces sp. NPDC059850]|uniref:DUF3592 domain-containing protein n=1 Tax=Streptomyces sp. NPDC059850 TaxID=3346970 RepID=UPI00365CA071